MKKSIVLLLLFMMACSSTELIENWKNPDIVLFDADKVLIVGMTQNKEARVDFETRLQREFDRNNTDAMRSIDVFDIAFTASEKSDRELSEMEQQLLDKDFDAVLLTKIVGVELMPFYEGLFGNNQDYYKGFEEDYLRHQEIYYDPEYYDSYTVYHAETSLYCLCVGKDRELIWKVSIDITDPKDIEKTIGDYVKMVVTAMKEQDLIFRKESKDSDTSNGLVL